MVISPLLQFQQALAPPWRHERRELKMLRFAHRPAGDFLFYGQSIQQLGDRGDESVRWLPRLGTLYLPIFKTASWIEEGMIADRGRTLTNRVAPAADALGVTILDLEHALHSQLTGDVE
jgi:hypothetical protein